MWGVCKSNIIQTGRFLKPQMCVSHLNMDLYLGHVDVFGCINGGRLFYNINIILKSVNMFFCNKLNLRFWLNNFTFSSIFINLHVVLASVCNAKNFGCFNAEADWIYNHTSSNWYPAVYVAHFWEYTEQKISAEIFLVLCLRAANSKLHFLKDTIWKTYLIIVPDKLFEFAGF